MLRFKDGQTVQPLYKYYETDIDSIDDQPVDYSKRYADQDSDEVCGSLSVKKRHLSTPSESDPNKADDELKVYCIEGTPLIISSASSLCDLREIGSLSQPSENEILKQPPVKKSCLIYTNVAEETNEQTIAEQSEITDFQPRPKNKADSITEEVGNLNFRTEGNLSKSSSPLMFSRSSSVGSLNSYEQHSMIDDQSTVSIFSTLASGIISPSEIPDSPGEVMSPLVHKNKQTEFTFPPNDNEKSIDPILASLKNNSSEQYDAFDGIPEDDIKVYDDEGDFSSVSNLSALTCQTNSHVSFTIFNEDKGFSKTSQKATIRVAYSVSVIPKDDFNCDKQNLKTSLNDHSKTTINCGNTFVNCSSTETIGVNRLVEDEKPNNEPFTSNLNISANEEKSVDTWCLESISSIEDKCNPNSFDDSHEENTFLLQNESESSKENSDDEADALLEECIKSGMPTTSSSALNNSKQISVHSCESDQTSILKENNQSHESISSENDNNASDDDNDLIEHCIQLGMPQISPIMKSIELKRADDSRELRMSPFPNEQMNISPNTYPNHQVQSGNSDIIHKSNISKSEALLEAVDSNEDENDNLLNHCIKLGMPEVGDPQKKSSRNIKTYVKQEKIEQQDSLYSENDASEDENALLEHCILLGKPQNICPKEIENKEQNNSKSETTRSKSEFSNISSKKSMDSNVLTINHQCKMPYSSKNFQVQNYYNNSSNVDDDKRKDSVQRCSSFELSRNEAQSSNKAATECANHHEEEELGYRDNIPDGTSDADDDDNDDILNECIRAGMPKKQQVNIPQLQSSTPNKNMHLKIQNHNKISPNDDRGTYMKKPSLPNSSLRPIYNARYLQTECMTPAAIIDVDSMCVYRTEDTPILSPSASISDLSTLSFSEDKMCHENYLNNSRNSDCSSDSEDDELLLQCIRSGMPGAKRAVA